MLTFFLQLFLAHLIGDFLLQPSHWVAERNANKIKSKYLYFHILVHAALLAILLQFDIQYWLGFVIIISSHWLIDLIKVFLDKKCNKVFLFLGDQAAHFLLIVIVTYYYFPFAVDWQTMLSPKVLLTIIALILLSSVLAVVIKILLSRWDDAVAQPTMRKSTKELIQRGNISNYHGINAGKYIGIMERLFIFLFILMNFWEGIGFLLAAKSIFRIGNLTQTRDKNLTEYILVGTLLSFGLAIVVSLAYKYLMQLL